MHVHNRLLKLGHSARVCVCGCLIMRCGSSIQKFRKSDHNKQEQEQPNLNSIIIVLVFWLGDLDNVSTVGASQFDSEHT